MSTFEPYSAITTPTVIEQTTVAQNFGSTNLGTGGLQETDIDHFNGDGAFDGTFHNAFSPVGADIGNIDVHLSMGIGLGFRANGTQESSKWLW